MAAQIRVLSRTRHRIEDDVSVVRNRDADEGRLRRVVASDGCNDSQPPRTNEIENPLGIHGGTDALRFRFS